MWILFHMFWNFRGSIGQILFLCERNKYLFLEMVSVKILTAVLLTLFIHTVSSKHSKIISVRCDVNTYSNLLTVDFVYVQFPHRWSHIASKKLKISTALNHWTNYQQLHVHIIMKWGRNSLFRTFHTLRDIATLNAYLMSFFRKSKSSWSSTIANITVENEIFSYFLCFTSFTQRNFDQLNERKSKTFEKIQKI